MDMRRAGERDEICRTNNLNEPHTVPDPLLPLGRSAAAIHDIHHRADAIN